jgi:hypothetical protein
MIMLYEAGMMPLHFGPISDIKEQINIIKKEIASYY